MMKSTFFWLLSVAAITCLIGYASASELNGVLFRVDKVNSNTQVEVSIYRFNTLVQKILLGEAFGSALVISSIDNGFVFTGNGFTVQASVVLDTSSLTLIRVTRTATQTQTRKDCVRLLTDRMSWYGGAQQRLQFWPIEKLTYSDRAYVTQEENNLAITERYWLNSEGSFIYVEPEVPLFLDQNQNDNSLCLVAKRQSPYDTHTAGAFSFNYYIGVAPNAKDAHLAAVARFLNKPTGHPADRMVRYPVWSTWARYKVDIDETVVQTFADEIVNNRFTNSQFEIDDDWEDCYGALTFRTSKFSNIAQTTQTLRDKGFMVTLWVHPFINVNCEPWFTTAKTNGYLVLDHTGSPLTQWWNSGTGEAAYIDFTKTAAVQWYADRLTALQLSAGIDSYKFDAGESSWSPKDPVLNGSNILHPSLITARYVQAVSTFGDLVEVRSGQNTQNLPIFLRMIDKDSEWTYNNGLPTLVTTLLQLNMVGYPLVLPDMVGGNGYNGAPDKELFIRWLQANVFMPSIQFSYVPWDYDTDTIDLCRTFTEMHANYADLIMERFALATTTGEPVNPPLWWASPNDRTAQQIDDQFLLGDTINVAPVLKQGAVTRNIYITAGNWKDGNTGTIHTGPKWLMNYSAPLTLLPFFVKV